MKQHRGSEVGKWGKRAHVAAIIGWCVPEWASPSQRSILPTVIVAIVIVPVLLLSLARALTELCDHVREGLDVSFPGDVNEVHGVKFDNIDKKPLQQLAAVTYVSPNQTW